MDGINGHSPEAMQQNGGQATPGLVVGSAPGVSGGMPTSAQQTTRMMLPQQMMASNTAMQQQNPMVMQSGSGASGQLGSMGHSPVLQSHMNQGFMQQPGGDQGGGSITPSAAAARVPAQQQMQMQNSGQNFQPMSGYGNQSAVPQMMMMNSSGSHQSGQPSPRHGMMVSPGSMGMSTISPSSMQSVMMMPGGNSMQNPQQVAQQQQQQQQQPQQPQQQQQRGQVMNSMQMHAPQHQIQQGYAPTTSSAMHYGQPNTSAVSQGGMQSMHLQSPQQGLQMMQQQPQQAQAAGAMHVPGGMGQPQQHPQNFQTASQGYSVGMQGQGYQPQQQQQQQQQHGVMHHTQQPQQQRLNVGGHGMAQQAPQQQGGSRAQFAGQGMPQQLQQQPAGQHGNMMQRSGSGGHDMVNAGGPGQAMMMQPMQGQQNMARRQQMPAQHMGQAMPGNPAAMQQNIAAMQRQPRQDMFAGPRVQPWHNASADAEIRARIKNEIINLLRDRRPDGGQAWEEKLPRMAERLELTLYGHAKTREEYADTQKLKQRLQELAQSMHSKHPRPMARQGMPQPGAAASQHPGPHMTTRQGMAMQAGAPHQMIAAAAPGHVMHQQDPRTQGMMGQPHGDQQQAYDGAAHAASAQQRRMVNLEEINPLMSARSSQQAVPSSQAMASSQPAAAHGHMMSGAAQQPQQPGAPGQQPARTQDEQNRREVLKQQQKRLLLLRHASKCPHDGKCPVTEYCANMKTLWRHIMQCKDQDCKVAHCISSRYVLAHYSRCKEPTCPVCGPVRDAIRKQHQRNQQIMSMNRPAAGSEMTEPVNKRARMDANGMQVVPGGAVQPEGAMVQQQKPRAKRELDPVSCAMYSFSSNQIQAHLANITEGLTINSTKVKQLLLPIIEDILRQPGGYIFAQPVDPVALGLPDYFDVIKNPMDLGTIKKRLETCSYRTPEQVQADVHLTFNNAMTYNSRASDVHSIAKAFKKEWDRKYNSTLAEQERLHEEGRKNQESCSICGHVSLKFEPPVFYCNGRCNGKRIRRNSYYYAATGNQYHWCAQCHQELRDNQPITLPDMTLTKKDLQKKKHDEHQEEPWVQCDLCHRWVHQICGLFNGRRNVSEAVAYLCPHCILSRRAALGEHTIMTKILTAKDLPHTKLSTFLEQRIRESLEEAYAAAAAEGKQVERAPDLFLRQVSSVDKMHTVRSGMYERYKNKNYPSEFPVRVKCLVLFQNIDGQDVILFGMYVYEYGHKCPQPNQRRVYISYLDSVNYFRPRYHRTMVYHEILVSYLDYVRRRGFHTAHIWACPPLKGDDYILYAHPQDQKTPKDDRLRQWYVEMLDKCQQRGIVQEVSDLHSEFLTDPTLDATALPYFEGDYWVGEAENIIKELSDEENDDDSVTDGPGYKTKSKKRKAKSKTKKSKPTKTAVLKKGERDPVMAKLASIIEPMKDAFFVARLHPKEYALQKARQRELEVEQERLGQTAHPAQTEEALQQEALNSTTAMSDMPPGNMHASTAGKRRSKRVKIEDTEGDVAPSGPVVANHAPFASASSAPSSAASAASSTDQRRPASLDADVMRQLKEEPVGGMAAQTPTSTPITPGASQGANRGEMTVDANVFDERSDEMGQQPDSQQGDDQASTYVKTEPDQGAEQGSDAQSQQTTPQAQPEETASGPTEQSTAAAAAPTGEGASETPAEAAQQPSSAQPEGAVSNEQAEGADATTAAAATAGEQPMDVAHAATAAEAKQEEPIRRDDTEDPDDTMECEFFDTRQAFLNLCQGNHYQFDQLRRAKHSSMMVLYHLHNPDAPKFVVNCHKCHAEILAGVRYHCETCGDKDFCHACYTQKLPLEPHPHPLRPIPVTAGQGAITGVDQRERRRKIELHLQLLQHAATCGDAACGSPNCQKMKDFLKHGASCESGVRKGCPLCRRLFSLLKLHAESCRREACEVPRCRELKEQMRQMQLRQQQMDDRRRAMMNEMYRGVAAQRSEDS